MLEGSKCHRIMICVFVCFLGVFSLTFFVNVCVLPHHEDDVICHPPKANLQFHHKITAASTLLFAAGSLPTNWCHGSWAIERKSDHYHDGLTSWESTPPYATPPGNKALLRDY